MVEFLDLPQHILEFEISVVGWSGCGLGIIMKYAGDGTDAVKNSGYFPACSAVVMLEIG